MFVVGRAGRRSVCGVYNQGESCRVLLQRVLVLQSSGFSVPEEGNMSVLLSGAGVL